MLIFPKFIYPLINLPLLLRHSDIKSLNSALSSFLWSSRKPNLQFHPSKGGLNVPNFRKFNYFIIYYLVILWNGYMGGYFKGNPIFRDSIYVWKFIFKSHGMDHCITPFTPLQNLKEFVFLFPTSLLGFKNNIPTLLREVLDLGKGKLLSWEELQNK
ncbi:hypothetical protein XELAEV_18040436mg [Xenopus laevis]|uniref:Uncharacterized protein n=1 Tax=Xenopus laevis TaxID=8355 RepID=A0A974C9Q5_XENLA|nr:hypothetical protein XELAEV_18040436mg [Xenopus laevis]